MGSLADCRACDEATSSFLGELPLRNRLAFSRPELNSAVLKLSEIAFLKHKYIKSLLYIIIFKLNIKLFMEAFIKDEHAVNLQ